MHWKKKSDLKQQLRIKSFNKSNTKCWSILNLFLMVTDYYTAKAKKKVVNLITLFNPGVSNSF